MSKQTCKIHNDNVTWTITRKNIQPILLGTDTKKGLLFLNVESAGEITFDDTSCKLDINQTKICNKESNNIKYKNGNKDSVDTPLAVVNFHTHPLSCYIAAKTIWGWPSGQDLYQCINFAIKNSLTHIIFSIEGTYIININQTLINNPLFKKDKVLHKNVEEIFSMTHKHRMYYNGKASVTLEKEFNEIFLKPVGLSSKSNILYSWLSLVNNLTVQNLIILSNKFAKYFKEIKAINMSKFKTIANDLILRVDFFQNETIQFNKTLSKEDIFKKLNCNLRVKLPSKIVYKSNFISKECKL